MMAYLHCHNCGWSQDDFWEEDGYNPFRRDLIDDLKEYLFRDVINMDIGYVRDMRGLGFKCPAIKKEDGTYDIKTTDFVAMELMRKARRISGMAVKTWEEWKQIKDTFVCPKCGKRELDID